jgi:tRNA 2-thiouridine synthesizing protein A
MSEHQLDARGLLCPMPVIRTQQKVSTLAPGDVLEVLASDPGVLHDIPAWCRVHGHDVLETMRTDREITVRLRVNAA